MNKIKIFNSSVLHVTEIHPSALTPRTHSYILSYTVVALGGLVVACLPSGSIFAGSNPAEDDGFLRAIKVLSTNFFGWEVKSSVPCKILRHVKEPYEYEINT
jgi:hypothetical protein